jgi:hypothetical protein
MLLYDLETHILFLFCSFLMVKGEELKKKNEKKKRKERKQAS